MVAVEAAAAQPLILPPWGKIEAINPPKKRPALIHGILRRGHVAILSGKGKSGKSWAAIQLSIAVATGGVWFAHKAEQGRVLYLDPEIDPLSLHNRFAAVADALGADKAAIQNNVFKWSLRGVAKASMANILHDLRATAERFDLVVIDSCSVFVEGDENSAVDVRRFTAKALEVASVTDAAVLLVHHYGKGSAGDKDASDRARGSSVWLDAPDCALTITEVFPPSGAVEDYLQPEERAFVLEAAGQREFAPMHPVNVIFRYPIHRADQENITQDWKPKRGTSTGGKSTAEVNKAKSDLRASRCEHALLRAFSERGLDALPAKEAAEICSEFLGETVKTQRLKEYVASMEPFEVEQINPQRWQVVRSSTNYPSAHI